MKTTIFSIVGAASFALVACGDVGSKPSTNVSTGPGIDIRNSGTGGGGGFGTDYSTGLDPNKTIDELSDTEISQACDGFRSYVEREIGEQEILEFGCTVQGFLAGFEAETDSQAQAACAAVRDSCIQEEESELEIGCPIDDAQGCSDVTVAEVEACTNAQVEAVQERQDLFACTNATTDPSNLEQLDFDLPECQPINDCEDEPVPLNNNEGDSTDPDPGE